MEKTNLIIHLSDNKAVLLNLKNFKPNGNLKLLKSLELIEFNSLVSLKDLPINYLIGAGVSNFQNIVFSSLKTKKDFLKVNNRLQIDDKFSESILFNFTVLFNLFVVTNIIIKFLWSKL